MPVVLTYWPVRGLGAGIRLSLTVAGVDFDNKMLTSHEDVGAAEAATGHPLYNTPTLTTEDGQVITQSGAILRHIAREYNLAGKNATERARVDEVLENIVDFRKELIKYTYADSAERAAELKPSLLSETIPYYFGGLDKYMAKNGTAFVASNEVTVADCLLFTDLDNHAIMLEQPVAEALAAFPALLKLYETMAAMPQVQQYQAHPAMGQLKANGPGASWSPMVVPQ